MTAAQPVNVTASRWSNQGPPAGFGGEYSTITGLKHGRILIQANQDEANLIAAAPELLAALKAMHAEGIKLGWHVHPKWKPVMDGTDAAIAKAEGGAA